MAGSESTATMQLIQEVQNGDETKMEALLLENDGLIRCVVRRFLNRGVDAEDLYQIGCIGFIKAVRNFDLSLGLCFSTYAVPTMCGEIRRFFRDDGMLKVSRKLKELAARIGYAEESWLREKGRKPTVSELRDLLEAEEEEIVLAMESGKAPESLYRVLDEDEGTYLIDRILGESERENGAYESVLNRETVRTAISGLPREQQTLIDLRYFREMTQSRTAELMGISQVQVSRMEKKILAAMRKKLTDV